MIALKNITYSAQVLVGAGEIDNFKDCLFKMHATIRIIGTIY